MPQQLQLFVESASDLVSQAPALTFASISRSDSVAADSMDDMNSDTLLEQTRQLFQHNGSNSELMAQIMTAIKVLDEICEQPFERSAE